MRSFSFLAAACVATLAVFSSSSFLSSSIGLDLALPSTQLVSAVDHQDDGLVRHFVSWQFKPEVTAEQAQEVIDRYEALFDENLNPATGNRMLSFDGGIPNSKEGQQKGMTQAFITTFASVDDRNYFVGRPFQNNSYDLGHDQFKAFVGPLLLQPIDKGIIVIDFTVGDWELPPQNQLAHYDFSIYNNKMQHQAADRVSKPKSKSRLRVAEKATRRVTHY